MKTSSVSLLAVVLGLSACVTTRATTTPGANLSQYRTFSWYRPANPTPRFLEFERTPAAQTVRNEIAKDLAAKGMVENDQNPDVLVSYHVKLQDKVDVTDWGYPGGWWGGWYGPGGATVSTYTEGTLFIDLIDPRSNQVVWRGTASAVVDHPENPSEKKIAKAVDKLMKKLPASEMASAPAPARM